MFSATEDSILTLIYNALSSELSLMKQDYAKGAVAWIRKIPGTFGAVDGGYMIVQDYQVGPPVVN